MFPHVHEIAASNDHAGQAVLFERVDHFRLVHPRTGAMIVRSLPLGSVTVATVRSTGHDIALDETDRATFLAPMSGTLHVDTGGPALVARPGGGILVGRGFRRTEVRAPGHGPFHALVAVAPDLARGRRRLAHGLQFPTAEQGAASALHAYLRYFVGEYARPNSALQRPGALRATEALILDLFLDLSQHDGTGHAPTLSEARVRQAEDFMAAHSDDPLTIAAIAEAIGVGPRSLQAAFRIHRGQSPRAVLAAMRLERAHHRLLQAQDGISVSDVALVSGFAHFGRFAAAYRARYGEAPSETRRRVHP